MVWRQHFLRRVQLIATLSLLAVVGFLLIRGLQKNGMERNSPFLLGTNVWPGYEPLYLARSLGHYDEEPIRLVEYSSASQVIREFGSGTIQAAAVTLDEALLLKERGVDFQVILVMDVSHGGDAILGRPEVESLVDLKGRSVGVEHSALGAYVLTRALQSVDLSTSDVTVVPLEVDEHEQSFTNGAVDAVVTFEPVGSRLMAQGAIRLYDSTQIPGEIVDVLVIRTDALEQYRSHVDTILSGWFEALAYFRTQPADASRRMSARLQLTPDEVLQSFQGLQIPSLRENVSWLEGQPAKLVEAANLLASVMKKEDLLQKVVRFDDCTSAECLKKLLTK